MKSLKSRKVVRKNKVLKKSRIKPAILKKAEQKRELRRISVPAHRYTPLRHNWLKIVSPVVEHLKLQIRFNVRMRCVEIRPEQNCDDSSNLQKAADFVRAFILGFDVEDALALLRLESLFVESFEIKDVKRLQGEHISRTIGRVAGKGGRTKFTIENATKTRIVIADTKIHILGTYQNIQVAMRAICNLILGSPPSKVYGQLQSLVEKMTQRV